MSNGVWSDSPSGATALSLDRDGLVKNIVAVLDRITPGQDSVVFGLVGPWGSGKSRVLADVQMRLAEGWKAVQITPWAASDSTALQLDFLRALASTFPDTTDRKDNAKSLLKKYSNYLTPLLGMIPVAGQAVKGITQEALKAITEQKPWNDAFQDLAASLRQSGQRVLIIADDIDRLDAEELMDLLKVVRLIGRFPNVHYLLAYDQSTVEALLRQRGFAGTSSSFMDKIVQFPFEIPSLPNFSRRTSLTATLADLMEAEPAGPQSEATERRVADLLEILCAGIDSPRALIRYSEQLKVTSAQINLREVDRLDLAALTHLRLFNRPIWLRLPSMLSALSAGTIRREGGESVHIEQSFWQDWIERHSAETTVAGTLKLLSFLFASVSADGLSYFEPHLQAFSNSSYTERYLISSVANDDVSDALIEDALDDLIMSGKTTSPAVIALINIVKQSNVARSATATEKAWSKRQSATATSLALVDYVSNLIGALPADPRDGSGRKPILFKWLGRELFLALRSGLLTTKDSMQRLPMNQLTGAILRMRAQTANRLEIDQFFEEYRGLFRTTIQASTVEQLLAHPTATRRALSIASSPDILDAVVEQSRAKYVQLLDLFVRVEHWSGSTIRQELAFSREEFEAAFSKATREHFAPQITVAESVTPSTLNYEDVSDQNRSLLASMIAAGEASPNGTGRDR